MSEPQSPSPMLLFETLNAYQRTAAMKAAIELELFTAVAEGAETAPEIAAGCAASERGTRILCDYLVIIGFLTKNGDRYGLTPDAAVFLDRRSPAYMGGAIEFLLSPSIVAGFQELTAAVRKGGTAIPSEGTVAAEHPVWVQFDRAMMPMMAMPAQQIVDLAPCRADRKVSVLDIAAGHGLFGIAFAQRYPHAEVTALDWPQVLEVARENAERAGVGDRHHLLPGSAFDVEYGVGHDLVLLTNFLHHFDIPTCETLLGKVHAALGEGGRAVTLEFIPNDDRVTPPPAAAFSLTMLGSTPSGDAYTFRELESMFRSAGFSRSELFPLPQSGGAVVVSHR
ncbi:MAG TPA: class I SAM-dependent methyltransferase [Armatimonadota bacterium]|nr:class I SAM-dependent methyltransferase [Armatimonadota bacterium]